MDCFQEQLGTFSAKIHWSTAAPGPEGWRLVQHTGRFFWWPWQKTRAQAQRLSKLVPFTWLHELRNYWRFSFTFIYGVHHSSSTFCLSTRSQDFPCKTGEKYFATFSRYSHFTLFTVFSSKDSPLISNYFKKGLWS